MKQNNTGIIIQARTGSTRLPGKMTLPFYNELTVLDLILKRFKNTINVPEIVVATTINSNDDAIVNICSNNAINVFRGSENNVLQRFIDCSDSYNFDVIVRVCADNPFLDTEGTLSLLQNFDNNIDYKSFAVSGNIPTIKTHLGFWGEIVRVEALKKINTYTSESLYQEHVTNFIYSNPDIFNCEFTNAPKEVFDRKDIRLTMDTIDDFNLYKKIYNRLINNTNKIIINELLQYIDNSTQIKNVMTSQIKINTK